MKTYPEIERMEASQRRGRPRLVRERECEEQRQKQRRLFNLEMRELNLADYPFRNRQVRPCVNVYTGKPLKYGPRRPKDLKKLRKRELVYTMRELGFGRLDNVEKASLRREVANKLGIKAAPKWLKIVSLGLM